MLGFLQREKIKELYVNEIDELIGKIELIDIREPYEYHNGSLRTAKNIPMGNLLAQPNQFLKNGKTYYIMCQSGGRSKQTTKMLAKQGFDVVNVLGGIGSYVGTKRK